MVATLLLSSCGMTRGNSFRSVQKPDETWETHGMSKDFTARDLYRDTQPGVREKEELEHVFPAVQPDNDEDFLTDDDSDNGEWDAQLKYDMVRSKVGAAQEAFDAAAENETRERALMDAASVKYDKASAAYNVSMEKRDKAYRNYLEVMDALRELEGDMFTPTSKISDAITELDSETEDYVDCKLENISRARKLEDLRQREEELEKAEMEGLSKEIDERFKRAMAEMAKKEMAKKAAEANATDAEEAEPTTTTTTTLAAEAELARLKAKLANLTASAAAVAEGEEARKAASKNATQELQSVLEDSHAIVGRYVAQTKSLHDQVVKSASAVDATKAELAKTQALLNATTTKYEKIVAEGDALEEQLAVARKALEEYEGYAKFTEPAAKNSAIRPSSYGLVLAGVLAAHFLN